MSITTEQAAAAAHRHGLSLNDASGLQRLASTPEEAERLAAQYAKPAQLTREQLTNMKPEAIDEAREAGKLADILGQGE